MVFASDVDTPKAGVHTYNVNSDDEALVNFIPADGMIAARSSTGISARPISGAALRNVHRFLMILEEA